MTLNMQVGDGTVGVCLVWNTCVRGDSYMTLIIAVIPVMNPWGSYAHASPSPSRPIPSPVSQLYPILPRQTQNAPINEPQHARLPALHSIVAIGQSNIVLASRQERHPFRSENDGWVRTRKA